MVVPPPLKHDRLRVHLTPRSRHCAWQKTASNSRLTTAAQPNRHDRRNEERGPGARGLVRTETPVTVAQTPAVTTTAGTPQQGEIASSASRSRPTPRPGDHRAPAHALAAEYAASAAIAKRRGRPPADGELCAGADGDGNDHAWSGSCSPAGRASACNHRQDSRHL